MSELTRDERRLLVAAAHDRDLVGSGCSCDAVCDAAVAIVADRYEQWEWNYGERVRRLESELETTEAQRAAARSALAAVREVRTANIESEGR